MQQNDTDKYTDVPAKDITPGTIFYYLDADCRVKGVFKFDATHTRLTYLRPNNGILYGAVFDNAFVLQVKQESE